MYLHRVSSIAQNVKEDMPPNAATSGDCNEEDSATLVLKWKSYELIWSFAKVTVSFLVKQI